ncbi:ABC-three component system protein [Thioflexithrix psekupsensis]|uniref:ABC-three component systems C-terminal domain-containing protein n=1 Tax=Thioflexithrix psekupsensis TaxID=1570016 RepID=A0A251X715_9GAMM|nr:ABC-three component system protein [Thioflexithrix psekupsensis]OUD13548.1 hypothetical protein TPSD3_10175 [Thioflexithrix psekupsensis]
MNNENFWFRTLFKVKIYETSSEHFQRLFQDVMSYRYPSFQSVAPYGNQGDGGNDGWMPNEGYYFQVYGKKASSKINLSSVLKKAVTDFNELRNNYGDIKQYHFVYNDRFEGTPAPIGKALLELKKKYNLEEASAWNSAKLERVFMELDYDQKESILYSIPAELPDFIDPRAIAEILKHLANKAIHRVDTNLIAPDFDTKIRINGLTSPVPDFLRCYSYQQGEIDDFLHKRDPALKQIVAEEMRGFYQNSKIEIPDSIENGANLRYVWIMEQLIPEICKKNPHSFKAYREAAQVILAKYFEACDIYESPNTIITS